MEAEEERLGQGVVVAVVAMEGTVAVGVEGHHGSSNKEDINRVDTDSSSSMEGNNRREEGTISKDNNRTLPMQLMPPAPLLALLPLVKVATVLLESKRKSRSELPLQVINFFFLVLRCVLGPNSLFLFCNFTEYAQWYNQYVQYYGTAPVGYPAPPAE